MKKIALASLLVFFALVLSGCTADDQKVTKDDLVSLKQDILDEVNAQLQAREQEQKELENTPTTTVEMTFDKSDALKYENAKYGFSVLLPKTWSAYKATEKTTSVDGYGNIYGLSFDMPNQNRLFAIVVYTKEQWQKVSQEQGPKPTLIKENEEYVFTYSKAQDYADEYVQLGNDIQSIISTFEFNQI
ncbi:MAG TPA: hypothetical protein PKL13_02145 [bacterium]|nr:hypothetical protein [bacterium]